MEFAWSFNVSFVNVDLAGKVNADQNKFGFDFDNSYHFLKYVIPVLKKGREVIFVDYSCSPL